MKYLRLFFLPLLVILMTGCEPVPPTSDQVQRRQQEAIAQQGNSAVGMPAITHFQEKRMLKQIFELRDQAITTYTYIVDMNGVLHKLCDSVGYGFSGATQFTNPQKIVGDTTHSLVALPQADPNGLFSPSQDEGTWIMCKDPHGDKVMPVRVEPRSIVSPFKLN